MRSSRTFHARAATPASVAQTSQLFSATEAPFTRKKHFRANRSIQIASMIREHEAFVRGFLRIPRVEDVKTTLSCEGSFKFHEFNSCPLYSSLLNSTLLCSTLLCSTLLNSSLPNSSQLYSAQLCSTQLYSTQLYS